MFLPASHLTSIWVTSLLFDVVVALLVLYHPSRHPIDIGHPRLLPRTASNLVQPDYTASSWLYIEHSYTTFSF